MKNTKDAKTKTIGDDLVITRKTCRATVGGSWIKGTVAGYQFDCLVFPEHADYPDYELESSRISKLWLKKIDGGETMANFDRGWDTRPRTKYATKIVEFLAANLAERVYDNH